MSGFYSDLSEIRAMLCSGLGLTEGDRTSQSVISGAGSGRTGGRVHAGTMSDQRWQRKDVRRIQSHHGRSREFQAGRSKTFHLSRHSGHSQEPINQKEKKNKQNHTKAKKLSVVRACHRHKRAVKHREQHIQKSG